MKSSKLSLIFMLIFVLLLGACSGGGKTSSGDGEKDNNDNNEGEKQTETEEAESYDLGGRVIRIADHYDRTPQGGTEIGDLSVERWHEVEKKYNVKIEWVVYPFEEKTNQMVTTLLAGEPSADIWGLGSTDIAPLIQQDYIYAVDDLVDLSDSKMSEQLRAMGTMEGKTYLFNHELNQSGGVFYNKTLFEQAGLPDPYEQQQAGEWTWDAYLEAAKKLTNGTTYGISGDPNVFADFLIPSNNGQVLDTSTGEMVIDSPNTIEALEFMAALYNDHKVVKPNEGNNWEDPRRYFTEGLVGMTQGWVWEAEGRLEAPFEWGYVMYPKGPKATDYVVPLADVGGNVIPKGVKDPEIVYKIWEDMQIWEYAEENVVEWFENVMPSEEAVDTATQMLNHIQGDYWKAYNLNDAFYETMDNIATGAESPTQAIAKVKGEAQARVDEFMAGSTGEAGGEGDTEESGDEAEETESE